ncbi:histidine phosphatase family protein [Candidatus Pacearchaeota archaeon]|nr:histidine phosphatase family protein [Candidatus Pacearchaeota archaeon]
MKIIFIRHGESVANSQKIHQGHKIDTPLSQLGKWQAEK